LHLGRDAQRNPLLTSPPPPRVIDTLATNSDFTKAGFHIGRLITVRVDTEKEHIITEALKCNLEFTSKQIKVSISSLL
jgi:hypothetical protein